MRLAERVARLEQSANGAADRYARDAAEFDRMISGVASRVPAADAEESRRSWAIGREMLRSYPGCAPLFINTAMEDWHL